MIQLTESLAFDEAKPFAEQADEVKQAIIDTCYNEALFEPPTELKMKVASAGSLEKEEAVTNGNQQTTFDQFARPRIVVIDKGNYTITAERNYIEQATNWRLHDEQFTVTIKQ